MKKLLFICSISLLFSSCIVIKVYETEKQEEQKATERRVERRMIGSDIMVPTPHGDQEILFFGEDSGPQKLRIIAKDSIKIKADSTQANIFIFKSDDARVDPMKWKSKGTVRMNGKPLIIIDGDLKEAGYEINSINPDEIESINVIKGEKALEMMGEKGKNGIIQIRMKS